MPCHRITLSVLKRLSNSNNSSSNSSNSSNSHSNSHNSKRSVVPAFPAGVGETQDRAVEDTRMSKVATCLMDRDSLVRAVEGVD